MSISNIDKLVINNNPIKTSFKLSKSPVALANSIRRAFSSMVPTITFDDTYYEDKSKMSIIIDKNSSALHNEFVSHRLSLLPINMNNDNLKIHSKFDLVDGVRKFYFENESKKPIFSLKIKNDVSMKNFRDKDGMLEVTTEHIKIDNMENTDIHKYFPLDPYTKYPIIINKLKSNVSNEDDGEELDITCIPKIGQGKQHARHDPTGTVTYSFEIDSDKEVDRKFRQKLEYINQERKLKGLSEYTSEEVDELRRSFNLLDRERVYVQVDDNPIVNFSIETIGFKTPDQIIIDGITMLVLTIKDIISSIEIVVAESDIIRVKTNPKVIIAEASGKNTGYIVKAVGENHTIGNLVNYYLRKQVIDSKDPVCSYAGYRMDHPLIEEVEWLYTLDDDSVETVDKLLQRYFNKEYFSNVTMEEKELYKCLENQTHFNKREYIYTCIIIDALRESLESANSLRKELIKKIGLKDPSFVLDDSKDYL